MSQTNKQPKLNIALVHSHRLGGSGVIATQIGHELAERGHNIVSVVFGQPFKLEGIKTKLRFLPTPELSYPLFPQPIWTLPLAEAIVEEVLKHGIEIINWHYGIVFGQASILAKDILEKMGITTHVVGVPAGSDIMKLGKQVPNLMKFTLNDADRLITYSNAFAEIIRSEYSVKQPIEVIYNFVDSERYQRRPNPKLRSRFANPDEKILIHISNFRPIKRPQDVISAFKLVKATGGNCKLLLVGDGPMLDSLLQAKLAKNGDIISVGKVQDVSPYLSISDLLLNPSEFESFGLAMAEAQVAGVPVIATKVGGIPEVVENGTTGYLTEVGKVEEMANYAIKLLTNKKLWEKFSEQAVQQAKEKFDKDKTIKHYEYVFSQVILNTGR